MKIKQSTFNALLTIRAIYMEDKDIVTSRVIANREELSQGATLKILRKLQIAGILKVQQGRGEVVGGFSLNRKIETITFLEIVEIMEGIDICENIKSKEKQLQIECNQMNDQFRKELSKYTVQDLLRL